MYKYRQVFLQSMNRTDVFADKLSRCVYIEKSLIPVILVPLFLERTGTCSSGDGTGAFVLPLPLTTRRVPSADFTSAVNKLYVALGRWDMFPTVLSLMESNALVVVVCAIIAYVFRFAYTRRKRMIELHKKVSAYLYSYPHFCGVCFFWCSPFLFLCTLTNVLYELAQAREPVAFLHFAGRIIHNQMSVLLRPTRDAWNRTNRCLSESSRSRSKTARCTHSCDYLIRKTPLALRHIFLTLRPLKLLNNSRQQIFLVCQRERCVILPRLTPFSKH